MRRGLLLLLCGAALADGPDDPTREEDERAIANRILVFFSERGALLEDATKQDARYTRVQVATNEVSVRLESALLEHYLGYRVPDLAGYLSKRGDVQISELASWICSVLPPHARKSILGGRFLDVLFDGARGTAVDREGSSHETRDAGRTWQVRVQGSRKLVAAHLVDDDVAWAVAEGGDLFRTGDGGKTWRRASYGPGSGYAPGGSHGMLPAPWYLGSLALVLFLLAQALRRPDAVVLPKGTVADVLVSDRPLRKGDPDHLGFSAVALGLSRFLRNEKTEPPLTIAVTGEWGTGKSSLMNLLQEDLKERGFRPVWFNAWHHQQEEHLLAALLQNIKERGVPPWATFTGLAFRLRLMRKRIANRWPFSLAILFLLSLSLVYIPKDWDELSALFGNRDWGGATAIAGLVAALVPILRSLTAFGMKPAQLMASLTDSFKTRDLEAQAGFRARFAREFGDVTEALHPRSLVLMIDDLDRCQPDKVTEVLEAVNFLVSCGDCFVILGLAKERVEHCVGIAFKDLAEDLPEGGGAQAWRRDFARKYLEKLINIEVPVPRPRAEEADQLERMVAAAGAAVEDSRRKTRARIAKAALDLALVVGLVAAVALGVGLGWRWRATAKPDAPAGAAAATGGGATAESAEDRTEEDTGQPAAETPWVKRVGELRSGEPSPTSRWPVYAVGAMILGAAALRLAVRQPVTVPDSKEFKEALGLWQPLIVSVQSTPRSIKRFLNRVRYLAMRQRPPPAAAGDAPKGVWPRLVRLLGRRQEETALAEGSIPEAALVGLCAVGHSYPAWLKEGKPSEMVRAFAQARIADLKRAKASEARERAIGKWRDLEEAQVAVRLDAHLPEFVRASVEVEVY